jgi:hypothetical protein
MERGAILPVMKVTFVGVAFSHDSIAARCRSTRSKYREQLTETSGEYDGPNRNLTVFKNVPGVSRLSALMGGNGVNIDALMIQDASAYVQQLFQAAEILQRIASAASYNSMRKDSAEFALIRMLVDNTDKAVGLLSEHEYMFDLMPVIALQLENRPGELAAITRKFGEEGININYVYGSVAGPDAKCLFIFCPENIDQAARIFK